ncbi:hypothetical protein SO802_022620 [Lithocarpus litseifolius]|uniref:RNase H type-1 domain-containing protein n=1 Tax=Lithocarpus litseifolius TaxID=425828 RepID=A0AAW2C5S2_9ROSI
MQCGALLLAVRCGPVIPFCGRLWCSYCGLCNLVNTPNDFIHFLFSPPFVEELTALQREDFLLFGAILCDVIWRQRNLSLFENGAVLVEELFSRISKLFLEHKSARPSVSSQASSTPSHQWTPPSISSIKINVDAAVGPHCSSIAVVARDWRGELVFACSKRVNTTFPLQAEAEAIKWALILSANLEFEEIIIESDSQILQRHLSTPFVVLRKEATIKDKQPISSAKEIARAAANASTKSEEKGRGTHSDSDANAWPWLSRTTTPRPALPISLKVAPSKLTLKEFGGGGDHLTRVDE